MKNNKKAALVLGSGGARGLAHIGVIEVLENQGYEITQIVGSSIGAAIGGVYAAGHLADFKTWICNLDRFGVYNLMDFTLTKQGFIKGEKVFNEMRKFVDAKPIENLAIPFKAVAVDVHSGEMRVFDKGDLFSAIRASVAIPSVLTPVYQGDSVLVDGGVMNPLPIDLLQNRKEELVVAVDLNAPGKYQPIKKPSKTRQTELDKEANKWLISINKRFAEFFKQQDKDEKKRKPNYFDLINRSFTLMQNRLTEINIAAHKPDILIRVPKTAADTFEFFKAEELIAYGKARAEEALKSLEK